MSIIAFLGSTYDGTINPVMIAFHENLVVFLSM